MAWMAQTARRALRAAQALTEQKASPECPTAKAALPWVAARAPKA
jgi:hypothetical protein